MLVLPCRAWTNMCAPNVRKLGRLAMPPTHCRFWPRATPSIAVPESLVAGGLSPATCPQALAPTLVIPLTLTLSIIVAIVRVALQKHSALEAPIRRVPPCLRAMPHLRKWPIWPWTVHTCSNVHSTPPAPMQSCPPPACGLQLAAAMSVLLTHMYLPSHMSGSGL